MYSHKLLTLTCPGKEYREAHSPDEALLQMREALKKMIKALKKCLGTFDYLCVVESQRDGYPHFHLILRGQAIAGKNILALIRKHWTQRHGMGNVDIQKNKSGTAHKMIRYAIKYLAKHPPELPKKKRLYTCSKGALEPIRKKEPKEWVFHKVISSSRCDTIPENAILSQASRLYDLASSSDADLRRLLLTFWKEEQKEAESEARFKKRYNT